MDDSKINAELPDRLELTAYGYNILLLHGWGGPNMVIRRLKKHVDLEKYHIILFGHIHKPLTEKVENQYFINPGTPTDKKFTDSHRVTQGVKAMDLHEVFLYSLIELHFPFPFLVKVRILVFSSVNKAPITSSFSRNFIPLTPIAVLPRFLSCLTSNLAA